MDNKVLDEAVEAMRAKLEDEFQWDCRGYPEDHGLDELRAALLASLPVLLASAELDNTQTAIEIAGSMRDAVEASGGDLELNDPEDAAELAQMGVNTALHLLEYIESIRSLYAPSLGEGDGR